MSLNLPGNDPVSDDETIYRRIPVSTGWYSSAGMSPEAFEARDNEDTGISVSRAKYKTIEDAANGPSKKGYYVAAINVADLKQAGIVVEPRPLEGDQGHAELPQFTCHTRDLSATLELRDRLASLPMTIHGPFQFTSPGSAPA